MNDPKKTLAIHVDGVTHASIGRGLACGLEVFDRHLNAIMRMYDDAVGREIDCMACVARTA